MTKKLNKYLLSAFFLLGTVALIFVFSNRIKRAVSYYENGQLKHEVLLKDGKPEGLGTNYYSSGRVLSKTNWKNGKKHGSVIFYFETGEIKNESLYEEGVCVESKDYFQNGTLEEYRIYDSLGRIYDVVSFKKDGSRDFKDPIFIVEKDTITLGEEYRAFVRLGNRQFDKVDIYIGDVNDSNIIRNNPPLPKFDQLTSVLVVIPDSAGPNSVSGVVLERSTKSDSFDVIPFRHRFFVKEKQ
jgi:hypothetical protein